MKQKIFDIFLIIIIIFIGLYVFKSIATDLGSGHQFPTGMPEMPERAN